MADPHRAGTATPSRCCYSHLYCPTPPPPPQLSIDALPRNIVLQIGESFTINGEVKNVSGNLFLGARDADLYISQIRYDKKGKYDPNIESVIQGGNLTSFGDRACNVLSGVTIPNFFTRSFSSLF